MKNTSAKAYNGKILPAMSVGKLSRKLKNVSLKAGETKIVSFVIRKGFDLKSNDYAVQILADAQTPVEATVHCATTSNLKPKIDGKLDEWGDAVPITFVKDGKKNYSSFILELKSILYRS